MLPLLNGLLRINISCGEQIWWNSKNFIISMLNSVWNSWKIKLDRNFWKKIVRRSYWSRGACLPHLCKKNYLKGHCAIAWSSRSDFYFTTVRAWWVGSSLFSYVLYTSHQCNLPAIILNHCPPGSVDSSYKPLCNWFLLLQFVKKNPCHPVICTK